MQAENKPKAFYVRLRKKLKETNIPDLARASGIKRNTLDSFRLGRSKGMAKESIEALERVRFITEKDNQEEYVCPPLPARPTRCKTVKEVQEEKGYTSATIKKYAKTGLLNYFIEGKAFLIALDSQYNELPVTTKKQLENRVKELEAEVTLLKEAAALDGREVAREKETAEMEAAFNETDTAFAEEEEVAETSFRQER